MTVTTFHLEFRHATAGAASGSVALEHVPFVGTMHVASLAFVSLRNPSLLESPTYHRTFPPTKEGGRRARRALKAAARRQNLTVVAGGAQ